MRGLDVCTLSPVVLTACLPLPMCVVVHHMSNTIGLLMVVLDLVLAEIIWSFTCFGRLMDGVQHYIEE